MPGINLKVNGKDIMVREGVTVLEACRQSGIDIPTLCHHPDISTAGNCRVCVVEVDGSRTLMPACITPITPNMVVHTDSPKVRKSRKAVLELILASHNSNCPECVRNKNCELQELAERYCLTDNPFQTMDKPESFIEVSPGVVRDESRCIMCTRCVRTCEELQSVAVIKPMERSNHVYIGTFQDMGLSEVPCTQCGQCINRCPTGALYERSEIGEVLAAIEDPDKFVVVQTAPAVRVGIGEALGLPTDHNTGQMAAALRRLGFNRVLDTDFSADLTIMEEGHELLFRLKKALVDKEPVALPMFTSCSPGWIKFIEHKHSALLPNLSSCKSPQQMFGALAKTYLAEKEGVDPSKVVSVSIMPCTAKKFEKDRPEMRDSGYQDVDYVLTTRELARMIKMAGLRFDRLPEEPFDRFMGESTGAAAIFGATGGVMEAAARAAYHMLTGENLKELRIEAVRGLDDVKETRLTIAGIELKLAVVSGLGNAGRLLRDIIDGKREYHFVEVMTCPGGCINGGGQPFLTDPERVRARMQSLYEIDRNATLRVAHENRSIAALYRDHLDEPGSGKAHHILHTTYSPREVLK